MVTRGRLAPLVLALGLLSSILLAASAASPARAATDDVGAITAIRAAHFAEPLVSTAPTSVAENLALAKAIDSYEHRQRPDDFSSLTGFLSQYPHSGWAAALQTNLGLSYLHDGYFSRAIDVWQSAWANGKDATEPEAKALVDRAVGELARLYSSFGQFDKLTALFAEVGKRPISGSATEAVQVAQETLTLVNKDPRHLFTCGPRALRLLMLGLGADYDQVDFLQWYRASPKGTNLAELGHLADKAKFSHSLVFRKPGQSVPVPAIVHWKVGHFAAIVGQDNGRFQIEDPVFAGQSLWVTQDALDAEASGYFLVPTDKSAKNGWRTVADAEAGNIWGKGPTNGVQAGDPNDPLANRPGANRANPPQRPDTPRPPNFDNTPQPPDPNCGMCGYNIKEATVGLTLSDSPVGYTPPIGPSTLSTITYNQREDSQPANFNFFNVSPKWTLNWITYVTDDPTNPGANVSRYLPGGGAYNYTGYSSSTGLFAAETDTGSFLVRASQTPITYQRRLGDGGMEVYTEADGSTSFPRKVFISKKIDPQGNALTFSYDSQHRLTFITDATGRQTTFTYGLAVRPLLVTKITDPFGRSAALAYDMNGRLSSITDVLGLKSSFAYDANSLVNSMTTPYGTTNFAYTAPGTSGPPRFVDVTDPLGYHEREEWLEPAPVPASDPAATVPQGMPLALRNQYLDYRNSFHWDKTAYILAGCTPTGGCDYSKARNTHFLHVPSSSIKSTVIESIKYPLENRIWYNYPGQSSSIYAGTSSQPIAIGRVLDDGTTQLSQFSYDTARFFKPTQTVDPVGRTTKFTYSGNGIDLLEIAQNTASGTVTPLVQFTYNPLHLPIVQTDAAGQTTFRTYNAAGQLTSLTNPLNQTTKYQYDSSSNLSAIINANNATAASYTYDAYNRVRTFTDSEGWTVTYDYDAADRITKTTYPDGTTDLYTYDKLDLASFQDRQTRVWRYTTDANRHLTKVVDPLGNQTLYAYNAMGQLTGLTDAANSTTTWSYDVQGRIASKKFADNTTITYAFENTTSRLYTVTDALGQVKQYSYKQDDQVGGITYINAANATPNVSFAYDPYFRRLVSMTDGTGTTQYSYVPATSFGALQLQQESSPLANSAITYAYDALGRVTSRTVAGAGPETFQYDAIGRLIGHTNDLGQFALSYLGQSQQIAQRQLSGSTLSTNWSYLPNSGDRRLAGIDNVGLSASQHSNYQFTTTPENFISSIDEASDSTTAYPNPMVQAASYNNLNQLTSLSGQTLSYDANGNLLSDGQRTYTWDAENRLVGITYPAQSGKQTAFSYDGIGRRIAIESTPAGGGTAVATNYVWCGSAPCQARSGGNSPTREYYAEGEFVPGTPGQSYYYGTDQIGSVRRVFAGTSSAPSYGYDPYGNALQATAPLTDFGYASMLYNADSGLYLTQYRIYDSNLGRWLSRDPIGEVSDPAANLYAYVGGNPVTNIDTLGLWQITLSGGAGFGGAVTVGYNSGQWNVGAWGGLGTGASLTFNPMESGCGNPGFSPSARGGAGGSLGNVRASVGFTAGMGPNGGYTKIEGSVGLGPGIGASVSVGGPSQTYSPVVVNPRFGSSFGGGASAYYGYGGTYTF